MTRPRTSNSSGRTSRNSKDQILGIASRLASSVGLQGVTIGGLAKAVGMSKSGLFAHFNSKDNLQLMILKNAKIHFTDYVFRPAFKKPRGEPRVQAIFENWIHYLENNLELPGGKILIATSMELHDQPGVLRDFAKATQQDLIAGLAKATRMAVDEKHFKKDLDVDQFVWSTYSYILGYYLYKHMVGDPKTVSRAQQSFSELVERAKEGMPQKRALKSQTVKKREDE